MREKRYERKEIKLLNLWGYNLNNEEMEEQIRLNRNKKLKEIFERMNKVTKKNKKKLRLNNNGININLPTINEIENNNNNYNDNSLCVFGLGNINKLSLTNYQNQNIRNMKSVNVSYNHFMQQTCASFSNKSIQQMNDLRFRNFFDDS